MVAVLVAWAVVAAVVLVRTATAPADALLTGIVPVEDDAPEPPRPTPTPRPAAAVNPDAGCAIVLGLAELRARLGAERVGDCIEHEHVAASGDLVQATTGGLLTRRAADGARAFTDGQRTWLLGPYGLQERANDARFDWEAGDAPGPTLPSSARRTASVAAVVAADLLTVHVDGRDETVRLIGVDAPRPTAVEGGAAECLGALAAAAAALAAPPGTAVELETDPAVGERTAAGELAAYVWLPDGRLLNRLVVRNGWAVPPGGQPEVRLAAQLAAAAERARAEGLGIWATGACGG